jgi:hypothetical protein
MNIEEALATVVHEGRHALDIVQGIIPRPSSATLVDRAFAELRAFTAASEFAQLNNLTQAQAFRHAALGPKELLISIADSYKSLAGITNNQLQQALARFHNL